MMLWPNAAVLSWASEKAGEVCGQVVASALSPGFGIPESQP